MEKPQKKILIGSNGGLVGIYLAKQYRKLGNYMIYGTDSAEITTGEIFVDKQYRIPSANHPRFLDALIEVLNVEKIDYYLPTHSKEVRKVSENFVELKNRTDARFLVSPLETFCALESKEQAYYNLSAAKIPTPRMITEKQTIYPIIMKGKFGSGSSSVLRIDNEEIYHAYQSTKNDVCFFEYINGHEYTVDCMFNSQGKLIAYNLRKRVKTIGGAVVISQNSAEYDILPWLRKIETQWRFYGCVNFQFIVRDNLPYFTDINLRYPSGGLPLTVQSGINIPEIMIRLLEGEIIEWGDYKVNSRVRTMYRYYDEFFSYDSN